MKYKFKTKPYEHQLEALKRSWNKREYAYFMEMGTGKSKVLIDNIALLYDKGGINAAIIVCTQRCLSELVWKRNTCSYA